MPEDEAQEMSSLICACRELSQHVGGRVRKRFPCTTVYQFSLSSSPGDKSCEISSKCCIPTSCEYVPTDVSRDATGPVSTSRISHLGGQGYCRLYPPCGISFFRGRRDFGFTIYKFSAETYPQLVRTRLEIRSQNSLHKMAVSASSRCMNRRRGPDCCKIRLVLLVLL